MNVIGNLLWIILGGFLVSLFYLLGSLILFITIVGIPFGMQTLKLGSFALLPFGRTVRPGERMSGCLYLIFNIIWILSVGIEIAIVHIIFGVLCAITIIGIPFARKHFELAMLGIMPFGHDIVPVN